MADLRAGNRKFEEIKYSDIEKIEEIGRGKFGTVHKARWKNKLVAIKEFESSLGTEKLKKEIEPLYRIESNPNIIEFYGVAMKGHQACIVMEFAACGSLHRYIHYEPKRNYTKGEAISFALQCAQGVSYLHKKKLLHRDLKPDNLLLMNDFQVLKICDFGTVAELKSTMTSNRGTPRWMAPEVFAGKKYSEKCDVYSWSIILWELFSRKLPFFNKEPDAIQIQVLYGKRPQPIMHCPTEIKEIMVTCWDRDSCKRLSMAEIVAKMNELSSTFSEANVLITEISEDNQNSEDTTDDVNSGHLTTRHNDESSQDMEKVLVPQANNDRFGDETSGVCVEADAFLPNEIIINRSKIEKIKRLTSMKSKNMKSFKSGQFGICFKAKWQSRTVVVKVYHTTGFEIDRLLGRKLEKLKIAGSHQNFIKLLDSSVESSGTYLIMEYADGGSLFDFLHKEPKRYYSAKQAFDWLLQLANALDFLNDRGLVHRDIRSANIFLTNNNKTIRIGDFLTKHEAEYVDELGKSSYCLPDEFKNKFEENTVSFFWGIIAWEVIFHEKPHSELHSEDYRMRLSRRCPEPLSNLMVNCLSVETKMRAPIEDILKIMNYLFQCFPTEQNDCEDEGINILQSIQDIFKSKRLELPEIN